MASNSCSARPPTRGTPGRAPALRREEASASQSGYFQSPEFPKVFSPAPRPDLSRGAADRAPRPGQGPAGATPGGWHGGGAPSPSAAHPARRPPRPASPVAGSQSVPPAARLSPPVCPRSSCSSRCSHALPSSQSLTSWSHPAQCNHPALCEATGGRAARGRGREPSSCSQPSARAGPTPP